MQFTFLVVVFLLAFPEFAPAVDLWKSSVYQTRHSLAYVAIAPLLGIEVPVTVVFSCDPAWDKESSGTLGFAVTIQNTAKLKAFPFDVFEGPDASVAPDVHVVVNRRNKPALTFRTTASGSYFQADAFCFNTAEVSKKPKSVPRSILQALADPTAETVQITIGDPRNPKTSLELTIPVAGKQADFQTLLTGLK